MRKLYLRASIMAGLILAIAMCGLVAAKEQVTLEAWVYWDGPDQALQAVLPDVQKLYPKVDIKLVTKVLPFDAGHENLRTSLVTGKGAPDIASIDISYVTTFAPFLAAGKLLDLSKRMAPFKKDVALGRQACYTIKGKLMGVEESPCTVLLFYLDQYYKENGFDLSTVKTWQEFLELGRKLKKKTGMAMLQTGRDDINDYLTLLYQAGGGMFDEQGRCIIDNKAAVDALTLYVNMIKDGVCTVVTGASADFNSPDWYAPFKAKQLTACLGAEWFGLNLKDFVPEMKGQWRARPLPVFKTNGARTSIQGGTCKGITSFCKRPDIAWDLIRMAQLTAKGAELWYKKTAVYPVYLPAYKSPLFQEKDPFFGGQKVGQLIGSIAAEVPSIYVKQGHSFRWGSLSDSYKILLEEAIYPAREGKKTPAQALGDIAKKIKAMPK